MKLKEWRNIFFVVGFLILSSMVFPYLPFFKSNDSEPYISFAILNQEKLAENYFPNDDRNVSSNVPLNWFVNVQNHMDDIKYVKIFVKMLNPKEYSANESSSNFSLPMIIHESSHILLKNENYLLPFTWSIVNMTRNERTIVIHEILINDRLTDVQITSKYNENLQISFELWVYSDTSNQFELTWLHGDRLVSLRNYFWFVL